MYQWLTRAFAVLAGCLIAAGAARADRVDDYMKRQMALNHVPGAAVAVVRDGRIVKLQTYGMANLEWRQRVTPDTLFQLASSTKPLTGLLLMRLQEAGKLALDASVLQYLPQGPEAWRPVTVRHLADHSSGIPDQVQVAPNATLDDYVAAAAALPLAHPPGASSSYGIGGYTVLGKVIEAAAGMPYAQALRHYVTGPLGMRAAFEHASGEPNMRSTEVLPQRAAVYDWKDGRHLNFSFHFAPLSYDAGGLLASVKDLAALAVALDGSRFLRRESLERMWQPAQLGNGKTNGFAIGWVVRDIHGRRTVGHSGGPALSDILHLPRERATFIVLTNGQSLYPYLAQGISELYYPAPPPVMPKGIEDTRPQVTAALRQVLADGLAGRVDEQPFAEQARKDFIPPFKSFLLPFFRSLSGLDELVLLSEEAGAQGFSRKYAARHGPRVQTWGFSLDKDGRILGFGPL